MISEVPNGKKPPDFYREMFTVEGVVTRGFPRPDSSMPGYLVQSKWDDNVRHNSVALKQKGDQIPVV